MMDSVFNNAIKLIIHTLLFKIQLGIVGFPNLSMNLSFSSLSSTGNTFDNRK